jgi:hypothetical protein
MPESKMVTLFAGMLNVQPSKAEVPAAADPSKTVEVDAAVFVWTDGLTTYVIKVTEETFAEIENQMTEVRKVWSGETAPSESD